MQTVTKQKSYELIIVEKFIGHLNKNLEIDDKHSESPDFILHCKDKIVGLELISYREQGPHNKIQERERELRNFIRDQSIMYELLSKFHIYLSYKEANDEKIAIPNRSHWEKLVQELHSVAKRIKNPAIGHNTKVSFLNDSYEERQNSRTQIGYLFLRQSDFPILSKYFLELDYDFNPDSINDLPGSSVSGRMTVADKVEIKRSLEKHLHKIPNYRKSIPTGAYLWLLIHSDGWPPTAHIANERIRDELFAATLETINAHPGDRFDKVWWLDDAYTRNSSQLYAIV